ncbi:MAG TPA: sigma 54-interacting transcriptional regulator [Actinomycetota bacterium]|nr:sigma 54-interacting transcriptional regulator [Actinomycetota bacterium]
MTEPATIGELRASGHRDRSVKDELREALLGRMRAGASPFPGVVGFDDSVIPALERGILAGHDLIFLGERGQAKTRLIRHLVDLLDERTPIVEGCEVNDHPYRPICARCRALVSERGDDTPVTWVGPDRRYAEKLATPDTAVADLIGDVDPIRVAEGRYLGDELTIHYGLVPRTNRGIVAINELPDLPERIQVALFNILEERDVQIRGYRVRLPLDLLLVATANPEDYTHRGRIVSPLKDRFGTQVRTHYPEDSAEEIAIMDQEARPPPGDIPVRVPGYLKEVLAALTAELRRSPHVNQRSGVSVRYSIGNLETIRAAAIRRAARTGEPEAVPRPCDLPAVLEASEGRIEFDTVEEGREEEILLRALSGAILRVFRRTLAGFDFSPILRRFGDGLVARTSDLTSAGEFLDQFGELPGLARLLSRLGIEEESPGAAASALEFALEGLHLSRRLNREAAGRVAAYRAPAPDEPEPPRRRAG